MIIRRMDAKQLDSSHPNQIDAAAPRRWLQQKYLPVPLINLPL